MVLIPEPCLACIQMYQISWVAVISVDAGILPGAPFRTIAASNLALAGPLKDVPRTFLSLKASNPLMAANCANSSRNAMIDSLAVYPVKVGGL